MPCFAKTTYIAPSEMAPSSFRMAVILDIYFIIVIFSKKKILDILKKYGVISDDAM